MLIGDDAEGNIIGCGIIGATVGEIDGAGDGRGYIVLSIRAICFTPCMKGSPILIPDGGAVV